MANKESAGGIIVNENNEIAMVFTDTKSWQFPKGTVEAGEEYFETAIREIEEETGLKNLEFIKKLPMYTRISNDGDRKVYRDIYYFLFHSTNNVITPGSEVTKCE